MVELDAFAGLLRTPRTRAFWAQFSPFLRKRGFVRRDDFLPENVPHLLGSLVLLQRSGGDFRYRLVGSNIAGMHGRDLTGHDLSEWPEPIAGVIRAQYDKALTARQPVLAHYLGPAYRGGRFEVVERKWEKLALPLAFAGDAPDGVLVCASECPENDHWPDCWAGGREGGCWCATPGIGNGLQPR